MLQYLLALCVWFAGGAFAGCAQNNCYNAFTHSLSIASPFCSTYIQSTQTITLTGTQATPAPTFPPVTTNAQLSSRCVLDVNSAGVQSTSLSLRLSSACSCINIVPMTVTVTAIAPPPPETCATFSGNVAPGQPPPDGNGFPVYTKPNGVQYYLGCGETVINGNTVKPDRVDGTYMFHSCVDSCLATTDGCVAVNYVSNPTAGTYTCSYYKTFQSEDTAANSDFAAVKFIPNR